MICKRSTRPMMLRRLRITMCRFPMMTWLNNWEKSFNLGFKKKWLRILRFHKIKLRNKNYKTKPCKILLRNLKKLVKVREKQKLILVIHKKNLMINLMRMSGKKIIKSQPKQRITSKFNNKSNKRRNKSKFKKNKNNNNNKKVNKVKRKSLKTQFMKS